MLQEEPSFLCLVPVKIVIRSLDMRPIHLIGVNTETLPDIFIPQIRLFTLYTQFFHYNTVEYLVLRSADKKETVVSYSHKSS